MTKNNFHLSKRLQMIANIVPKGVSLADIGADHGHLIGYLKENERINKGYASDNKEGPYSILKSNLSGYDIETDLAEGIMNLPSYIDCVLIAGMGGDTIIKILGEGFAKLTNVKYLVISGHSLNDQVRRFLFENGYHLINQDACYDPEPKFYEVMLFEKGYKPFDEIDIKYGRYLIKNNNISFIFNIQKSIEKISVLLQNPSLPTERLLEMQSEMDDYKELLDLYERERAN